MKRSRLLLMITAMSLMLIAASCAKTKIVYVTASPAANAAGESASLPPAEGTTGESSTPAPATQVGATAENPVPVGAAGDLKSWSVKVVGFTPNADQTVAHENMFNDKPKAGYHYVIVTLKTSNIGNKSSDPFFDLAWAIIGSDGRKFNASDAVLPNQLSDVGNVPPGAFAQGNVGFQVQDGAKGLVLYLEDSSSFNSTVTGFFGLS